MSRAEADAVRSLWMSPRVDGLRIVMVDASPVHGRTPSLERSIARRRLGARRVPVIQDDKGAGLARRYGVTRTPTVFLLGTGIVRGRWDTFVPVAELVPGSSCAEPKQGAGYFGVTLAAAMCSIMWSPIHFAITSVGMGASVSVMSVLTLALHRVGHRLPRLPFLANLRQRDVGLDEPHTVQGRKDVAGLIRPLGGLGTTA